MTPAQLDTLGDDIAADPALANQPQNADGDTAIQSAYAVVLTPAWFVWDSTVQVTVIFDNIIWTNLTPNDPADATALWSNRSLVCQGKQLNLQTMLTGRTVVDATKVQWRAGLQDALTGLPSGASGASRAAGWTNVHDILSRPATRFEKLFSAGPGTLANPALAALEGVPSLDDIQAARRG